MAHARHFAAVLAAGLILPNLARADDPPRTDKLDKSFASLTLTDPAGKPFALADFKNPKAVVVVFLSFDCPVSNGYMSYLADLARTRAKDRRTGSRCWA
jgi:hypothetical protein